MQGATMRIGHKALIALLVVGSSLAACNQPVEVRYRITVEVNDRGTIRSGSSVWSFALAKSLLPLASKYNYRFRGEAVAVKIPGRGTLFALVDSGAMYPENLFGDLRRPTINPPQFPDRVEDLRHIKRMDGATEALNCVNPAWIGIICPKLIRFRNIEDPRTIKVVSPRNLAEYFGNGVSLRKITVRITNDSVTTGITKVLPWLNDMSRYRTDPSNPFTSTLPRDIVYLRGH
jgi:hypothetical protein